ncbi:50S ribosomal protein L9 [Coprothermobacteraceae bacterium]|nr:50S ribosomal protein L9 [Coprothermobacteraceae bacterium]
MRVYLTRDVPGTGKKGQIVDVAEGYARNYLLKNGLAVVADEKLIEQIREQERRKQRLEEEKYEEAKHFRDKLAQVIVTVKAPGGETGKLYGAVTSRQVAQAIKEQTGLAVDSKQIEMSEPIKSVGTYEVAIHLFKDISAKVRVKVQLE